MEPVKTNFKILKFNKMKSSAWQFYMCFLSSCEIWIFSGSRRKLSLVLLQTTYYIYSPLKNVKKNIVWLKIFWCKGFVHWKLKLLNFLLYSVLLLYGENNFCHQVMVEWFVIQILLNFKIFKLSKNLSFTHYHRKK